jgi:hypothetical protein
MPRRQRFLSEEREIPMRRLQRGIFDVMKAMAWKEDIAFAARLGSLP